LEADDFLQAGGALESAPGEVVEVGREMAMRPRRMDLENAALGLIQKLIEDVRRKFARHYDPLFAEMVDQAITHLPDFTLQRGSAGERIDRVLRGSAAGVARANRAIFRLGDAGADFLVDYVVQLFGAQPLIGKIEDDPKNGGALAVIAPAVP